MGGVCDHINHFCYHIKEIRLLKAWGAAVLKGLGENTDERERESKTERASYMYYVQNLKIKFKLTFLEAHLHVSRYLRTYT